MACCKSEWEGNEISQKWMLAPDGWSWIFHKLLIFSHTTTSRAGRERSHKEKTSREPQLCGGKDLAEVIGPRKIGDSSSYLHEEPVHLRVGGLVVAPRLTSKGDEEEEQWEAEEDKCEDDDDLHKVLWIYCDITDDIVKKKKADDVWHQKATINRIEFYLNW